MSKSGLTTKISFVEIKPVPIVKRMESNVDNRQGSVRNNTHYVRWAIHRPTSDCSKFIQVLLCQILLYLLYYIILYLLLYNNI